MKTLIILLATVIATTTALAQQRTFRDADGRNGHARQRGDHGLRRRGRQKRSAEAAEKRAALDAWAAHVLAAPEGWSPTGNVVTLGRAG